jgi:hypothetical protein
VADVPQFLTLARNRDRAGRREVVVRRVGLAVLGCVLIAGLADVFGQGVRESTAVGADAVLEVSAPDRVRGGLYYQARFRVRALRDVRAATLVLDRGWLEGLTINTIEPSPVGEASRDGRLALDLGHVPAGGTFDLYVQIQVNPTTVGRRSQRVRLLDGERLLASVSRSVTIFP